MKSNELTKGKIGKTLVIFAIPFLLASFLQALYGAVDLFVVGKFDTSTEVSAVAIGSQLMQTITGITMGISMGITVLIGHAIGEKKDEKAANAVGSGAILFIILAIVLTPVVFFSIDNLISILHTPAKAVTETRAYLKYCSLGIPFIVGYNGISGIFRGIGDSKTPMFFVLIACIINITLDFVFIGAFDLGAEGAALATVIAQGVSFIISLVYIYKKGLSFKLSRDNFKLDKPSVRYILKVGSPLALQDALVNVSFLIITAIINTMGLVASASVGVVEKIIIFAMLPPTSFASAVSAMTAQNIGAGKPNRAKKTLFYGIGFSLVFEIIFFIIAQINPEMITSIFSNDKAVISSAADYLMSYSIDCILVCFVFCLNAYFSGCGKSVISFIHSMIATFLVRVPMSYFMANLKGSSLYDIGFAAPLASLVSIIICIGYFLYLSKKKNYVI